MSGKIRDNALLLWLASAAYWLTLIAIQCVQWIKTASWQQAPLCAVLLNQEVNYGIFSFTPSFLPKSQIFTTEQACLHFGYFYGGQLPGMQLIVGWIGTVHIGLFVFAVMSAAFYLLCLFDPY